MNPISQRKEESKQSKTSGYESRSRLQEKLTEKYQQKRADMMHNKFI